MLAERWRRIESLFHAIEGKSAEERSRFLEGACGSDQGLRAEVESLLANVDLAASFLESDASGGDSPAAPETVPPGERIGPYTVLGFLGAGGMGEVYRAHDERLERDVALKFLPRVAAANRGALARFEREARAASALNHPNICTVHDVGEFQQRSFIVMELLEGRSLKDRMAGEPLSREEFYAVGRQVCEGLQAAHTKGIVHRDVKPANIFVTQSGQVKILDFGLAKRGRESLTASTERLAPGAATRSLSVTAAGTILGTLAYMSPEQATGEEVDARSDIFSLGVVLYEMITGQQPFRAKTPAGIIGSILCEVPVKPSAINGAVPARLERLILNSLEKDREIRYQSAAQLAADLEACQRSEAESAAFKTRRWTLMTAGAGLASLAAGAFLARRSLFPSERRIMLAVLPFENIGGNPQESFFATGLHQDMISVINRLYPERLGVIARTSVIRYQAGGATIQQVGRDLNVDYVVEGGVQRDRGQAHVSARLVRVKDQISLWNATFDRDLEQVVAVQAEIARAIAQGIERGLRADARVAAALARPLNASAHEAYLRGDYAKAVEIDPGYAAAFSGLAMKSYYPGLFGMRPPREAFTKVLTAASRGVELDPTQAVAHASLALGKLHLQWDWSEAGEGLRRARRLDPADGEVRHFYGHYLLWAGESEQAALECRRGLEVDPYNPDFMSCIAWHELCAGHEDKAIQEARRTLAFDPKHRFALLVLGLAYEQKGMFQEALAGIRSYWDVPIKKASMAHVFARSGERLGAQEILAELLAKAQTGYVSPYEIAAVYAGLDDREKAFEWLNRACEEHTGFLLFMNADPRLKPLRMDPRFQDLRRRMRYPNRQA